MAAELVNLRRARKQNARAERERTAERNRFEHGRTRHEKELAAALNRKAADRLAAGRIERTGERPSDEDSGDSR